MTGVLDIPALRTRLNLTPYDALSFGAPDRTGWYNVEVVDTLTGDFHVVGQLRGTAFRPMGASQATMHVGPVDQAAKAAHLDDLAAGQQTWAGILAVPVVCLGTLALGRWHAGPTDHYLLFTLQRGTLQGILALLAAVAWALLIFWYYGAHVEPTRADHAAPPTRQSPAETLPSDDFAMATVNCPHCGSPVSTEQCAYCGWVRVL